MDSTPRDAHDDAHDRDRELVERRAELLPEEQEAGSDDPEAQAEEILEDSERRTLDPSGTRSQSSQTLGED